MPDDFTPLFYSCSSGDLELSKVLVERGADVNFATAPLWLAAQADHHELLEYLLTQGADPRQTWNQGAPPLYICAQRNCLESAKVLLENEKNKADVDQTWTLTGMTPLLVACEKDNVAMVDLLLKHGADPLVREDGGATPLSMACEKENTKEVASLVLDHLRDPILALGEACDKDHLGAVRCLLEKFHNDEKAISLDVKNILLHIACAGHQGDVAEILIDTGGADVDALHLTRTTTVLYDAYAYDRDDDLKALLKSKGADAKKTLLVACDFHDDPAKCLEANEVTVKILDDYCLREKDDNFDLDAFTTADETLLVHACEKGNLFFATQLLDRGCDPNRADRSGATPLFAAYAHGRVETARLLRFQWGADVYEALRIACETGDATALEGLLGGADDNLDLDRSIADSQNSAVGVALHVACAHGHLEVARVLIDHGADLDQRDDRGDSPMHRATHNNHTDLVRLLLDHGADPNQTNDNKKSPLRVACEHMRVDITRLLLDSGADATLG